MNISNLRKEDNIIMAKTALMKVWDVELGLAIHIKAPNGKYIVIDLGSKQDVSPLKSLEGKDVGYLIITHPHHDHFSDIKNIGSVHPRVLWRVKSYTREELMERASKDNKENFERYCNFTEQYNQPIKSEEKPSSGNPFDGLSINIFFTQKCNKSNINNFSAIAVLKLGNVKVIICGDNEKESFAELLKSESFKNAIKNSDVLIAPHHGRESGYCLDFLNQVKPKITIISDTSADETSVTDKYDAKTIGCKILNKSTQKIEERKCLSTRNDGNIIIQFGESEDLKYSGTLIIHTHCNFI